MIVVIQLMKINFFAIQFLVRLINFDVMTTSVFHFLGYVMETKIVLQEKMNRYENVDTEMLHVLKICSNAIQVDA